jgi:hypothetical protein
MCVNVLGLGYFRAAGARDAAMAHVGEETRDGA